MSKVIQSQPALIVLCADHAPYLCGKPRLPICGEAHHLVLVAVLGETEELSKRGIKDAKRMREGDGAAYLYLIVLPHAPHHAAEITEAIDRDNGRLLKGRREE